jgi:hypothetical protein
MKKREKHWIEHAVAHAGSLRATAARAGQSTAEYAKEHDSDLDKTGRRARLAETLMRLAKKKD